ncbi:MAG: hypothetical protein KDC00_06900 [Flavobacteriales bacterium]|nr:hypothetical protein [Flavobacteriales bacterium]
MRYRPVPILSVTLMLSMLVAGCSTAEKDANAISLPEPAVPVNPGAIVPDQIVDPSAVVSDPNPAHGEPGHRCEIPVGASLSSAPAPGGAGPMLTGDPGITTSPVIQSTSAPGTVTAPGMNPPHGEPGHDCAVPVGSPLPG